MPYNLLYSRNITSDNAVQYIDIPIRDRSIMVDVLSLVSQFHRVAGWIHPIVPASETSYERLPGMMLLYGKTRITTPALALPYFLEFFPHRGRRSGIISVYTGNFGPPVPPQRWTKHAATGREFSLMSERGGLTSRQFFGARVDVTPSESAESAYLLNQFVGWQNEDGSAFVTEVNVWNPVYSLTSAQHATNQASPSAIAL